MDWRGLDSQGQKIGCQMKREVRPWPPLVDFVVFGSVSFNLMHHPNLEGLFVLGRKQLNLVQLFVSIQVVVYKSKTSKVFTKRLCHLLGPILVHIDT